MRPVSDSEIANTAIDLVTARLARIEAKRLRNQNKCENQLDESVNPPCYVPHSPVYDHQDQWCENCLRRNEHYNEMQMRRVEERRFLLRLTGLVRRRQSEKAGILEDVPDRIESYSMIPRKP